MQKRRNNRKQKRMKGDQNNEEQEQQEYRRGVKMRRTLRGGFTRSFRSSGLMREAASLCLPHSRLSSVTWRPILSSLSYVWASESLPKVCFISLLPQLARRKIARFVQGGKRGERERAGKKNGRQGARKKGTLRKM